MNKKLGVLILGIILVAFLMGVVSANTPIKSAGKANNQFTSMIGNALQTVFEVLKPVLDIAVGDTTPDTNSEYDSSEIFLIKVFFLIIVFVISWKVLDKMPLFKEVSWVPVVVGIAVSVLSVRFIKDGIIAAILFPYSVYGVALTSFLPFLIYFFATMDIQRTGRKLAWVFFAVVFGFIYFIRQDKLGDYAFMYLIIAVLSIIVILADPAIHKIRMQGKIEKIHDTSKRKMVEKLSDEMEERRRRYSTGALYTSVYNDGHGSPVTGVAGLNRDLKDIEERIKELSK